MIGFIFQQYNLLPKLKSCWKTWSFLFFMREQEQRNEKNGPWLPLEKVGLAEKWKNMPNQLIRRPAAEGIYCQGAGRKSIPDPG